MVTDYAIDGNQWAIDQLGVWKRDVLANVSVVAASGNRLSEYIVPKASREQIASAQTLLISRLDAIAPVLTRINTASNAVPEEKRKGYFRKLYGVIDSAVSRIYFALDVNPAIRREERITEDSVREQLFRDALPVLEKILSFGSNKETGFLSLI